MYRVIIADDEPVVKMSLKKLIESAGSGFTVVGEATNGMEAKTMQDQLGSDVIVTDICMPVMDGLELIEAVKQSGSSPKVLILSGYDEFDYAQKAVRLGAFDYLLKPIEPDVLKDALSRVADALRKEKTEFMTKGSLYRKAEQWARQLTEFIWMLDTARAGELLEQIRVDVSEGRPPHCPVREVYAHLLVCLESELRGKGDGKIDFGFMQDAAFADDPSAAAGQFHNMARTAADVIRCTRNWGSHQTVTRAVKYLEENFQNSSLTLEQLSKVLGMSLPYLSRLFKKETGETFLHYLTRLRMEKAIGLLQAPHCKIYETAFAVGYKDYSHFAKAFKKHTGLSPSEFMKIMGA